MRFSLRFLPLLFVTLTFTVPSPAQQFDEKMWGRNSPGVELATHEEPRTHDAGKTIVMYNIVGKGFPTDKKYDLWFWNLGKKPQKGIQGVSFDKRGLMVCSGKPGDCIGKGPDDAINIQAAAMLGEAKRFGVVSTDGRVAGFVDAVPFPIEATDKKCKLSVVRDQPMAEVVTVSASGLVPFELLKVTGNFGAEQTTHSPTVSPQGTWQAVMGVKSPGQDAGTATIKVTGQACSMSLSFPWGEGSNKPQ